MKNMFITDSNASDQKANKYINLYLDIAIRVSEMSYAQRLKVGSIIVKNGRILSMGWNGMPHGFPNKCEFSVTDKNDNLKKVTKPEVLHSEANSILKLAKSQDGANNSTMFSTHSPCVECAKLIHQSGIKEFIYINDYRNRNGIKFLERCNINVQKVDK